MKCNGPNEFFSCGSACVNECRTIKTQNQTHCPIVNIVCNKQCYCEDGYAYDENKICIPISQCPRKYFIYNEKCPENLRKYIIIKKTWNSQKNYNINNSISF